MKLKHFWSIKTDDRYKTTVTVTWINVHVQILHVVRTVERKLFTARIFVRIRKTGECRRDELWLKKRIVKDWFIWNIVFKYMFSVTRVYFGTLGTNTSVVEERLSLTEETDPGCLNSERDRGGSLKFSFAFKCIRSQWHRVISAFATARWEGGVGRPCRDWLSWSSKLCVVSKSFWSLQDYQAGKINPGIFCMHCAARFL